MKLLTAFIAIFILTIEASSGGINDELVSLLSAREALAMAPAQESPINDIDPHVADRTFGMIFNPKAAFTLEEGSLEKAILAAKIESWTLAQNAPWSPGKASSWVVLDYAGHPFLAIMLKEDQPNLIYVKQVIRFDEGVATLGRSQHRYFRCELTSNALARFLRETVKNRSALKFTPKPDGAQQTK